MEQQLDFGNCYYRPSFFHMKIDLPIDFTNLNEIPDGAFGLYLHEYIHFVQDISTIYGLMNISTITHYIQYCASKIYKDQIPQFEVPISLQPNSNQNNYGYSNFKLRPIYIGSSIKQKSKSLSNFSYKLVPHEFEPNRHIDIVKIQFTDSTSGELRSLEFGGNHVTCLSPLKDWTEIVNQFRYSKFRKQCQNQDDNLVRRRSTVFSRRQSGRATARPAASTI